MIPLTRPDPFSQCHPGVNALYFALVPVFTMFFLHPVSLAISLVSALTYTWLLRGGRGLARSLAMALPVFLLAAVINPAFNHRGVTILAYLPSGNPLTLESLLYGLAAAAMLAAVLLWFSCCTRVMTADKFVYLFGRVVPSLGLILSMTLRFIPRFTRRFRTVARVQKSLGRDTAEGTPLRRLRRSITILSIIIMWSLEDAIDTADSMKGRGYGLPGRTAFSLYRLDSRDRVLLLWLLLCGLYIGSGWIAGGFTWQYYPTVGGALAAPFPLSLQLTYLALCMTPVILFGKEVRTWNCLPSRP